MQTQSRAAEILPGAALRDALDLPRHPGSLATKREGVQYKGPPGLSNLMLHARVRLPEETSEASLPCHPAHAGLSSHLGVRPNGHRGSGPHRLHQAVTHQQARRLLGHPLQLGSPTFVSPHPSLSVLQPTHDLPKSDGFALLHNNLCRWRAGVLRPLWWTQGYWTVDKATDGQWYTTHTPSLPGELDRFCSSSHWKNQTEETSRHCS